MFTGLKWDGISKIKSDRHFIKAVHGAECGMTVYGVGMRDDGYSRTVYGVEMWDSISKIESDRHFKLTV